MPGNQEDGDQSAGRRKVLKTVGTACLGSALTVTESRAASGPATTEQYQRAEKYFRRLVSVHGDIVSRTVTPLTDDRTEWRTEYEYADGSKKSVYRRLTGKVLHIRADSHRFNIPVTSLRRRSQRGLQRAEEKATEQINKKLERRAEKESTGYSVATTDSPGYDVTIGQNRTIFDANDGGADDNSYFTGTGYIKADWINESPADPSLPKDSAIAIANANPGASVPNGAAQVYTEMNFQGSGSQTVEFDVNLDYAVELVCLGGGGKMKVQSFVYDYNNNEFLEKDTVQEASKTGTLIQAWSSSGTVTKDMFVEDVSPGDTLAVGTRVIVSASAAGVSDAYADAWPKTEGDEHTKQNFVTIDWQ